MIELILATETVMLCLLGLLVLGLLRSHAEILRRLETFTEVSQIPAPGIRAAGHRAPEIAGVSPLREARSYTFQAGGPDTLLAFLSSGCSSCTSLIEQLEDGVDELGATRILVVTKDPAEESPSKFKSISGRVHVIMSSAAWSAYRVPGSPYFAYIDGATGTVVGEGSATSWERVQNLLGEALNEAEESGGDSPTRITAALQAAGVNPGDASLYPSRG